MAAATFHSGKTGRVTATSGSNTYELATTGYRYEESTEIVRYRNSLTSGGTIKEATFFDCKGNVTCDFDHGANPFVAVPAIVAGASVTMNLYPFGGTSTSPSGSLHVITAIISRVVSQLQVEGKTTIECEFEGTGTPTHPANV